MKVQSVKPTTPWPSTVATRCVGPQKAQFTKRTAPVTVLLALAANVLVAVAKTVAATASGSASMLAEAAHSWADSGNEVFLVVAERRSRRPVDDAHPLGFGREVYVWSLFAALGLFVAGGAVSITHGVQELVHGDHLRAEIAGSNVCTNTMP